MISLTNNFEILPFFYCMINTPIIVAKNIHLYGVIVLPNNCPLIFLFRCCLEAIILFSDNGGTTTVFVLMI